MIYFDNRATTRIDSDALNEMNMIYTEVFGNPSSLHRLGFEAEKFLRSCRDFFAKDLGVSANEIYFAPSATFANNLAIQGTYRGGKCLLNPLEHASSYNTVKKVYNNQYIEFDLKENGEIDEDKIRSKLTKDIKLVVLMHINNETGEISNIKRISKIIKDYNEDIVILCDGVQAFGKEKINLRDLGVDMYVASSHKINGPRGVGLIYIRQGLDIKPIIYGGGQEKNLVSGTENLAGIVGFKKAYENMRNFNNEEILKLNSYIRKELVNIEGCKINGHKTSPYIISVSFENIKSEPLIHMLESHGVYVSSGSACNKGEKSRVLEKINLDEKYIDGTIRISFDKNSTLEEVIKFMNILKEDLAMVRSIMS